MFEGIFLNKSVCTSSSSVSTPKMTCSKSGSTANGIKIQVSFNTTAVHPWLEIHSFPEGLNKFLSKYQNACCDRLDLLHEPVGRMWKAAELLYQLGNLIKHPCEIKGFLRCLDQSGSSAPVQLARSVMAQLLGVG